MLSEEIKTRVEQMADDAMKSPICKDAERKRIELETKEFLLRKGKVLELPPSTERAESLRF